MHLTTECTALSNVAINGIKELGLNVMLLCNDCLENNERDNFIRCRTIANVAEKVFANVADKIDNLDVGKKLKSMETRLTDLVDQKIGNAMETTCEKVEKTYAAVIAVDKTTEKTVKKDNKEQSNHSINKCFRIQGVPEDPKKTKGENMVPTNEKVTEILNIIGANPKVEEFKRLGKFSTERKKPRTLLVTVSNEHEARLILAKSHEYRDKLTEKNLYILPALTKEDAIRENQVLKRRRELLEEGVPREKLKIRNLQLFNDGKLVATDEGTTESS